MNMHELYVYVHATHEHTLVNVVMHPCVYAWMHGCMDGMHVCLREATHAAVCKCAIACRTGSKHSARSKIHHPRPPASTSG